MFFTMIFVFEDLIILLKNLIFLYGIGFSFYFKNIKILTLKTCKSVLLKRRRGSLSSQKDLQKVISKKENILKFIKGELGSLNV